MPFGGQQENYSNKKVPTLPRRRVSGELLPMKVPLYEGGGEIVILPITEGRFNELECAEEMGEDVNVSKVMIEECLIKPKITWAEFQLVKPKLRRNLMLTLLFECGLDIEHLLGKKKMNIPDENRSEKRKIYEKFKHDLYYARKVANLQGYGINYLNIPQLTKREVMIMIEILKGKGKTGEPEKAPGRKK